MKRIKKLTAALLCAATLCSLLVFPAGAAGSGSVFPDVTDPDMANAVETLYLMGVIAGGDGGRYYPDQHLTRAQFCKFLVLTLGYTEADAQAETYKTKFRDVTQGWAKGYINLASSDALKVGDALLIRGTGNGNFEPDREITYAEAVTILLRVLDYGDAANTNWPAGAVSAAHTVGLADGLGSPTALSQITRGQAALLFYNMLLVNPQGSNDPYLSTMRQVDRVQKDVLLLSIDSAGQTVTLLSAESGASSCRTAGRMPSAHFLNRQGDAVFNTDGLFLTFLPGKGSSKSIVTAGATGTALLASDGAEYPMSSSIPVWYNGEKTTYGTIVNSLNRSGLAVTVHYTASGAVDYLYVGGLASSANGNTMVAMSTSGNPFAAITGSASGFTVLRNGAAATLADVQPYDVGVFDDAANVLYVCDFRLSGTYQSATPNATAPYNITVNGWEFNGILDSASADLSRFDFKSAVTLLFTYDGKVAGAMSTDQVRANALGIVTGGGEHSVTLQMINAPAGLETLDATILGNASFYLGQLVSITGGSNEAVYLSRVTGKSPDGPLNVRARTVGSLALADNVLLFERVGNSQPRAITLSDLAVATVDASRIDYVRTNAAGKVDLMMLNDVTGDCYTYGLVTTRQESTGSFNGQDVYNTVTTVTNGGGSAEVVGGLTFNTPFGGLVQSNELLSNTSYHRSAGNVNLTEVKSVTMTDFNLQAMTFTSGSLTLPVASGVQCYNARTGQWFKTLQQCLFYSNNLTVYYDRTPELGGKVRIVVAN